MRLDNGDRTCSVDVLEGEPSGREAIRPDAEPGELRTFSKSPVLIPCHDTSRGCMDMCRSSVLGRPSSE
jgi:hypothetical protein